MANVFQFSAVTQYGQSLLAQATAANPIVYTGAYHTDKYAESADELAGYTSEWYDGASAGQIDQCSASGDTARIIVSFSNIASDTAATVRSVAVLGKLLNDEGTSEVIFAATSSESNIQLPPITEAPCRVRFGFSVTLNSTDIVRVTPANNASVADLERYLSLHSAGNPSVGDDQTVKGEKTFVDHVELADADIDRYELGTGFVGGDMTVDANIIPETTTSWLGDNTHPWGCVATQSIRNRWVENDVQHVGEILVYATTLKPDPNANVSGLGTGDDPWEVAYIQTLTVTEGLSCEGTGYISDIRANTLTCSDIECEYRITAGSVATDLVMASSVQASQLIHMPLSSAFTRKSPGAAITSADRKQAQYMTFASTSSVSGSKMILETLGGTTYTLDMTRTSDIVESPETHEMTVPVGACVFAMPPMSLFSATRDRIRAGMNIYVPASTWPVAEWTQGDADLGGVYGDAHYRAASHDQATIYLPEGHYRLMCSMARYDKPYGVEDDDLRINGVPVLLQRIESA